MISKNGATSRLMGLVQQFLLAFIFRQIKSLQHQHNWTEEDFPLFEFEPEPHETVREYKTNDGTKVFIKKLCIHIHYDGSTKPVGTLVLEGKFYGERAYFSSWIITSFTYLLFLDSVGTIHPPEATMRPKRKVKTIRHY